MALIVKKFGGTSLSDLDHVRNAAERVREAAAVGERVAVVVSAMAGTTDRLLASAEGPSLGVDAFERDVVAATGEQVAAGVFALALQGMGLRARSWLGWQVPIITDTRAGQARILRIETDLLNAALAAGETPVVAGFQGISETGRITTLGRGGSDTTAVALAAALNASRCDIYTDVPGIYTADPNIVPGARQLSIIGYREILALARGGAKVMHPQAVAYGMEHNVPIEVRTSYEARPGTLITFENDGDETKAVKGIASLESDAKVTLGGACDSVAHRRALVTHLREAGIDAEMMTEDTQVHKQSDIAVAIPRHELARALACLSNLKTAIGFTSLRHDPHISKITLVGRGIVKRPDVAQIASSALASKNIALQGAHTSETGMALWVTDDHKAEAVRALHVAMGLERS